uniref:Uncharacterized protein n=1 Tax=viral metagenome TaxID=1070528 RepID=A0A6C0LS21_9ZZZZ
MFGFDYYKFQQKITINKIHEELTFYEKSEYKDYPEIREYITYLRSRIGLDKQQINIPIITGDINGNEFEVKHMNIDEYNKDMDKISFERPWIKLKPFHKIMKIKEFVNSLTYSNKISNDKMKDNREYISSTLIEGLSNKKFRKGASIITYNENLMKIMEISCVSCNKKGLYEIDWND